MHYTPTSASWINRVERFFALLTEPALERGVFRSVGELETAIKAYVEANKAGPKPFRWTKTASGILAGIQRFCLRTLEAKAQNEPQFRLRTQAHEDFGLIQSKTIVIQDRASRRQDTQYRVFLLSFVPLTVSTEFSDYRAGEDGRDTSDSGREKSHFGRPAGVSEAP